MTGVSRTRRAYLRRTWLIGAGGWLAAGCTQPAPQTVRQLEQADGAFQAGRYAEVERLVSPVISARPDSPEAAEALYLRGLARLAGGQRAQARSDLEAGLERARRPDLTALIHAQLGHMEYDDGAYVRAVEHYRRAAPDLPPNATAGEILLRYGNSLLRSERFGEARTVFARVLSASNSGRCAADARRKLYWPHEYFSIQCGAFAQRNSAQDAVARLRARGVQAGVEQGSGGGGYMVLSGKYRTYGEASGALASVRRAQSDAFVVP